MSWSINEVARMSNVTSRTLRHYDAIGLLPPAWTDHSGRRHYEEEQLLRLQQILLLRELGLGLGSIAEVLDAQSEQSTVAVLQRHRTWLRSERRRVTRLLETVEHTIENLEKGEDMAAEKLFEGFDPADFGGFRPEQYVDEARTRWGSEVDKANARVKDWTRDDWARFRDETDAVVRRIAELFDADVPAGDERMLDAMEEHYRLICLFWTPNREAFIGLGRLYVDDERFARNYETVRSGLAAYMRDAMEAYANARL
ncbi:MAG: MerR family transcriptional regulator [Actinomycetota bacterium]